MIQESNKPAILVETDLAALQHVTRMAEQLTMIGLFKLILCRSATSEPGLMFSVGTVYVSIEPQTLIVKLPFEKINSYVVKSKPSEFEVVTFDEGVAVGAIENWESYVKMHCEYVEGEINQKLRNELTSINSNIFESPRYTFSSVDRSVNRGAKAIRESFDKVGEFGRRSYIAIADMIGSKPKNPEPVQKSEEPKTKSKISSMFESISNKMSKVFDPIVEGTKAANSKLCKKIDESDKNWLKSIKSFASRSNETIKNAFYTMKYSQSKQPEQKKQQLQEPTTMTIENKSSLEEIQGKDDALVQKSKEYDYQKMEEKSQAQ